MSLTLAYPNAVVFDMDGLLLDSECIALDLLADAAHALSLPWQAEVGLSMVGLNLRDADAVILAAYGDSYPVEALRQRFGELYEAAIIAGAILPKPFARELLEHLQAENVPCAVATSTRRTRARAKLGYAGLLPYFRALACGDEVTHGKPAPEIFRLAAQRTGVLPEDCLALEDSNAGVRGAVAARMAVVMVPDMLQPDADIASMGVPVVPSLRDVLLALSR